ncbi:MAG: glutamine--fructose-6-phosphate transaminase (isomerizing) [Methanomassiliicoccales archaeon]|jgi:glucosamine--fructose-6-phosphate aminotransferase (isomerizing)|nr:glutamine--fructose-6-phosphate transaminase (isomerizing) [Methanomassiliicoccales archaeon]
MCGIIGYTGPRVATEVILDALKKLEYRGYDSAGVAISGSSIQIHKDKGEISVMESTLPHFLGGVGIGHTRWATCGKPSKPNAHPFADCTGSIALVHNGIIENYAEIKRKLIEDGHIFTSETDTEVLVHLIEKHNHGDLRQALVAALSEVRGTYAIVLLQKDSDRILATRKENPLVVGLGVGENFVASDVTALLNYTNKVLYVMDDEIVELDPRKVTIYDPSGIPVERKPSLINWSADEAQKGGFEHFMLKEIFEQPEAIRNTLRSNLEAVESGNLLSKTDFPSIKIVACGTSYHAALVGKYVLEKVAKVPTTVELASEYRYGSGAKEHPLVVLISQSGETADTLAAAREARRRGCQTLAITNVVGSTLTREVDEVFYTRAGPEIGVAATKTFITQLIALYLIAMRVGDGRRSLSRDDLRAFRSELLRLPQVVRSVLDSSPQVEEATDMLVEARDIFFLGRNINFPIMLEGALKLKEISYIHAEGYAAGELKHGPLALLDSKTPTVAACPRDHTYDKMLSNVAEVQARDSPVLAIGFQGDRDLEQVASKVILVPEVPPLFSPFPITVALQLLSYYVAKRKGCSIDKPKNLAKSVTVE